MNSKILSHNQPIITSFPSIAATMIALQTDLEKSKLWLASHYIQLISFNTYYDVNWLMHITNFMDAETAGMNVMDDCELLKTYKLPRFPYFEQGVNICDLITDIINENYYITLTINNYYVPFSPNYNKKNYLHSTLIYGYDDSNIYIGDFFASTGFRYYRISKIDFEKAFYNVTSDSEEVKLDYLLDIQLFKLRNNDYCFNYQQMKQNLIDYRYSTDSTKKYLNSMRLQSNIHMQEYGISCYDIITDVSILKNKIDIRPFHVLCDHKSLMKLRFDYLIQNNYIKKDQIEKLTSMLDDLCNITFSLRNNMIKELIKPDVNVNQNDLVNKIWILKNRDAEFTKILIDSLIDM